MVSRIWIPTLAAGALALRLAAAAAAATAVAAPAGADLHPPAERLPIRVYTIDDGLAGDEIHAVLQDSRGFLWIATESGLSRFDGTRFVEYDPRQGLPSPNVTGLAEAAGGALLAGTTGGLARLDPGRVSTAPAFSVVPDASGRLRHRVTALLADGGTVWAADPAPDGGLFRLQPAKTGAGSAMSIGSATSAGSAAEGRAPARPPVSGVTSLAPRPRAPRPGPAAAGVGGRGGAAPRRQAPGPDPVRQAPVRARPRSRRDRAT